jgi:hypothetical protein
MSERKVKTNACEFEAEKLREDAPWKPSKKRRASVLLGAESQIFTPTSKCSQKR